MHGPGWKASVIANTFEVKTLSTQKENRKFSINFHQSDILDGEFVFAFVPLFVK